jgi:hypothetical protein
VIPTVAVSLDRAGHAVAGGFDDVLSQDLAVEWRQLTVPIDDLPIVEDRIRELRGHVTPFYFAGGTWGCP